jgi:lipopolysaccharide/colanic/teichoic acid biosynthesis glycosyltransferase
LIVKVKPGLSGVGSILFRREEDILGDEVSAMDFYDNVVAPYKGEVEAWYVDHQTVLNYFFVIALTVWKILLPSSNLEWTVFKGLPVPPDTLKGLLNYPSSVK